MQLTAFERIWYLLTLVDLKWEKSLKRTQNLLKDLRLILSTNGMKQSNKKPKPKNYSRDLETWKYIVKRF